jgi:hypothetical protein
MLLLTEHHAMKAYWGNGRIASCVRDLGTRGKLVVSFMPLPLYSRGRSPLYQLDRRLRGPRSRSGRGSEAEELTGKDQI